MGHSVHLSQPQKQPPHDVLSLNDGEVCPILYTHDKKSLRCILRGSECDGTKLQLNKAISKTSHSAHTRVDSFALHQTRNGDLGPPRKDSPLWAHVVQRLEERLCWGRGWSQGPRVWRWLVRGPLEDTLPGGSRKGWGGARTGKTRGPTRGRVGKLHGTMG